MLHGQCCTVAIPCACPQGRVGLPTVVDYAGGWPASQKLESPDPRAYAVVLCVVQMGVFAMHEQLSWALGVDVRTPEGHTRMMSGLVDVFSRALLTPEQAAQLHAAMDQLQAHPSSEVDGDCHDRSLCGGHGQGQPWR